MNLRDSHFMELMIELLCAWYRITVMTIILYSVNLTESLLLDNHLDLNVTLKDPYYT